LVHPGITPLSDKNKPLSAYEIMQVLMKAEIAGQHHLQYLVEEPYPYKASIYKKEVVHFLHRPVITQISRWDRLKGWIPLMKAFVHLKKNIDEWSKNTEYMSHRHLVNGQHKSERHKKTLENCCLILAGPDPKSIEDDPEGLETLQELKDFYDALPQEYQKDIMIIELPMDDVAQNAVIVNAIQRASYVIIQNSIREGFGLTATGNQYIYIRH
jgi:trehalose synthase